jgi:hypothetical protein
MMLIKLVTLVHICQAGTGAKLFNPQAALLLYGGEANLVSYTYRWDSINSTGPSCLVNRGPYLTVQAGCLSAGGTYIFRLAVTSPEGRIGAARVSGSYVCHRVSVYSSLTE